MDEGDARSESLALLLDQACNSKYGINNGDVLCSVQHKSDLCEEKELADSCSDVVSRRQRLWTEAVCSLIACISFFMSGMTAGFTSPTLTQLSEPDHPSQLIESGSIFAGAFGVST